MGPLMFSIMKIGGQQGGVNQGDEGILTVLSVVYLVLGLAVFASGVLSVFGGVRALKYRGRTLVVVALCANLVPMFTCYCAPTSMGLMIYGLIVLFNADVARAFELGDQGISRDEIAYRFSGRSHRGDRDDDRDDTDDSSQPQSPIRPHPAGH